jgi:hypothetical protein
MDTLSIIIFSIVMLHLIAGFGYLVYKLSGKKKDNSLNT